MTRYSIRGSTGLLSDIAAFLAIVFLYLIFYFTGIGCPIRFLTGISCPGCGMTRAVISLFSHNFTDAWYFHPLVFILPFVILVFLLKERLPDKVFYVFLSIVVAAFIIVFLARMFDPQNDVVTFQLHQGFIVRAIKKII